MNTLEVWTFSECSHCEGVKRPKQSPLKPSEKIASPRSLPTPACRRAGAGAGFAVAAQVHT
jgi:hypothetical protein